jgi:prepilin-type N-terminal cleavage/methylation domain-containing protein
MSDDRHLRQRRAFTLIELLVALTTGAVVLLAARQLVVQLAESARASLRFSAEVDSQANAERLARALAGRIQVVGDGAHPFVGTDHEVRFSSWCDVAAGWQEQCSVTLAIVTNSQSADARLMISSTETGPIVVKRGMSDAALIYLSAAGGGGQWVRAWRTEASAPLAIGLVSQTGASRDTLVFRIGARE